MVRVCEERDGEGGRRGAVCPSHCTWSGSAVLFWVGIQAAMVNGATVLREGGRNGNVQDPFL